MTLTIFFRDLLFGDQTRHFGSEKWYGLRNSLYARAVSAYFTRDLAILDEKMEAHRMVRLFFLSEEEFW